MSVRAETEAAIAAEIERRGAAPVAIGEAMTAAPPRVDREAGDRVRRGKSRSVGRKRRKSAYVPKRSQIPDDERTAPGESPFEIEGLSSQERRQYDLLGPALVGRELRRELRRWARLIQVAEGGGEVHGFVSLVMQVAAGTPRTSKARGAGHEARSLRVHGLETDVKATLSRYPGAARMICSAYARNVLSRRFDKQRL